MTKSDLLELLAKSDQSEKLYVITSYSIHYTKLYDLKIQEKQGIKDVFSSMKQWFSKNF